MHAYHMHPRTWPYLHMHTYGHRPTHTLHSRPQPYPDRWLQVRSPWVSGHLHIGPYSHWPVCDAARAGGPALLSSGSFSLPPHTLPFPLNRLHVFLWTWGWCLQPEGCKGATWAQVTRAGRCGSPPGRTQRWGRCPWRPRFTSRCSFSDVFSQTGPCHLWDTPTFPF